MLIAFVAAILDTWFALSTVSKTLLWNRFLTRLGELSAGPNSRFLVSSQREPRRDAGLEWVGVEARLLCEIGESPLELLVMVKEKEKE